MGKKRWWGEELANLKRDYESREKTLLTLVNQYGTSLGQIARLARDHRWAPRRPVIPRSYKNPEIEKMQARREFLQKTIGSMSREMSQLEHRIRFLNSLGIRGGE